MTTDQNDNNNNGQQPPAAPVPTPGAPIPGAAAAGQSGLAGAQGAVPTPKAAAATPAPGNGGGNNNGGNTITGAGAGAATGGAMGRNFKKALGFVFSMAVMAPPAIIATYEGATAIAGQQSWSQAWSDTVSNTKTVWQTEIAVPLALTKAAYQGAEAVAAPAINGLLGAFGMASPIGAQASEIVYCHPKVNNTGELSNEDALRYYTESARIEERARTLAEVKGGPVDRMLQSGGYPVITGYFTDTVTGAAYNVMVENAGSAAAQSCPVGNFQPDQRWAVTIR